MRNEKLVHSLLVHLKSKEPAMASSISLFLLPLLLLLSHASEASTVIFYNKCTYTVWPGIQASSGQPLLVGGGFKLSPKRAYTLQLPSLWSGRFWGRHGCSFDRSGRGRCATGDCGGSLLCNGAGGVPPATLAEITLGHDQDFYDVSLVDGYNLAMSIMPVKGTGKCTYAGCVSDLNRMCPVGLQVRSRDGKQVVACKSACSAFNSPRYCCTGSFGNPQTCRPTAYSKIFKVACPKAYSYAYDDPTSIATCTKANYVVTFCPHRGR
ncbi:Pathogenesis-related thaumatin superfamily protein [Raphanus sativus]|uniref:Thaumatin-like protein isoform X1 n=1 Tax=Raphanus sativus TaxID=3726 RepID=A0A6J0L1J0_RAPSA|nr:thaumatin-like protein isoform X1 [Raphanus sativus]KAJ4875040.1 Pathogenesis-related thaumatin superfamily protein [Raphanus sativus]